MLSCFIVGCVPLPAESAPPKTEPMTPATPVTPEVSESDASFVRDEINRGRAVFYDDNHPIRGCEVAAIYANDGSTQRLAALASNELPSKDACSRATQLVTARSTMDGALTFEQIAALQISPRATYTHLTSKISGKCALNGWNDDHVLCTLPCDAWVIPGVGTNLRDLSNDRTLAMPPSSDADAPNVVVKLEKEHKEPALGWALFGAGIAATPFAVYGTYAMFSSTGGAASSGSSGGSSGGSAGDQLAGMLFMPLLTVGVVAMAGWGLWYLVHKPGYAPVARREVSRAVVRCGLGGCSF